MTTQTITILRGSEVTQDQLNEATALFRDK
jgi:hypothetical protein